MHTRSRGFTLIELLGADTDALLLELGYRDAEVAALREAAVIGPRPAAPAAVPHTA